VSQIFWLSLGLNLGMAILVMAFAPVAQLLFREPRVAGLILVAAISLPIQGLCTVYSATLYRDLKFRRISLLN
jgi:O-antigen/teichoic acid export membrane protein